MAEIELGSDSGVQLELPLKEDSKTLKQQAIQRYLERAQEEPDDSSSRKITHESFEVDSCVNLHIS